MEARAGLSRPELCAPQGQWPRMPEFLGGHLVGIVATPLLSPATDCSLFGSMFSFLLSHWLVLGLHCCVRASSSVAASPLQSSALERAPCS